MTLWVLLCAGGVAIVALGQWAGRRTRRDMLAVLEAAEGPLTAEEVRVCVIADHPAAARLPLRWFVGGLATLKERHLVVRSGGARALYSITQGGRAALTEPPAKEQG